ncbi:MAG: YbaN family protein [Henriciella sp.]|nr:YbaN family protein [Henriciella sp.]
MLLTRGMILLRILGGIFFLAGAIGLILPIWPTTIFWILAAYCFARSSPAMRDWIYRQPGVGSTVEGFVDKGILPRKSKLTAIGGILVSAAISAYFLRERLIVLAILLSVLACVSVYIVTRREA